jgi:hypothetical protein
MLARAASIPGTSPRQNLAFSGSGLPQLPQLRVSGLAHSSQNLAVARFS